MQNLTFSQNFRGLTLKLVVGDITEAEADALVNAANTSLLGGGGVDGAIHRAGGKAILEECKQIRALNGGRGIAPGEAVITTAGKLKAKYVIHTVGPIWRGGTTSEATVLQNAYSSSLRLAQEYEVKSLAFPSISTGAYGYPVKDACKIALTTVLSFFRQAYENPPSNESFLPSLALEEVSFVLFDALTFKLFKEELQNLTSSQSTL